MNNVDAFLKRFDSHSHQIVASVDSWMGCPDDKDAIRSQRHFPASHL